MKKTTESSLTSSFKKELLDFDDPNEWLKLANGFSLDVVSTKFNNAIWEINNVIQACEVTIQRLEERQEIIRRKMEELGILDGKISWIKDWKLKDFKNNAEKYGAAIEHLRMVLSTCERIKMEFGDYRDKFRTSTELANEYLYRLSKIDDKED